MISRSVYIIGGAGSGKSTFMNDLLERNVMVHGPLEDLHSLRNAKALVTLRGHRVYTYEGQEGLYLGCIRDAFPGTDGLDRASSPVGEAWLNEKSLPPFILSEGATLATRRFLYALRERTDFLLIHLRASDEARQARFARRGSTQNAQFVQNTITRSLNLATDVGLAGARVLYIDTEDLVEWQVGLEEVEFHISKSFSPED